MFERQLLRQDQGLQFTPLNSAYQDFTLSRQALPCTESTI